MIRLVILTILFISSFSFGAVNENLDKLMESQKHISIENTITSEDVNKNQTTENTNKPVGNTQSSSNNKTNQIQSNKNTTTQNNENNITQSNTTPMPTPTSKPTVQIPKCEGNKHGIETGNSGRWFNTESEAIAIYDAEIKKWGDKWTSGEIDKSTYLKNCPSGYEDWSCPYCHKWTINFYYR